MLVLQHLSYLHPNHDVLFEHLSLTVNQHDKIALVGNNGSGKSTLLRIIAGELPQSKGEISLSARPYYVPQIFGQYNHLTITQALGIENKVQALKEILDGNGSEADFAALADDWTVEERCLEALAYWQLPDIGLSQKMENLSGGQKTKVFLAGISIHLPELVLLDEPSNHLDQSGRELLYDFIQSTSTTLLIVSHDRKLLNLLDTVCELGKDGIAVYGGNYEFYASQKQLEANALNQDLQSKEKALRKAKELERETLERQQKLDARGKKKQEKAGVARIMLNTLKNKAENSTSKMKNVHSEKIGGISKELRELRSSLPELDKMKFGFDHSTLHRGKVLVSAKELNFHYDGEMLWPESLNFQIASGERIALKGGNGSGKTTLIKLILGTLESISGSIYRAENKSVYIDQDYSLIRNNLTVYGQAQQFNVSTLLEHEIKTRLNRFLFGKEDWDKPCGALSGGEKMRLMLCCLTIGNKAPDMIVLDEPTNNLDLQNIEILTNAVNEYQGTLVAVSHDTYFLERINIGRILQL